MKRLIQLVLFSSVALAQQGLNNSLTPYQYTLPTQCPGTTTAALADCANVSHPNMTLHGAGSIWAECTINPSPECITPGPPYDPNFVHYIRVTDADTNGTGVNTDWHPQPTQGGNDNVFDSTNTRFVITRSGNVQGVFSLDPNPASPTHLHTQRLYGISYIVNSTNAAFSVQNPSGGATVGTFYTLQNSSNVTGMGVTNHAVIMAYDFSNPTTAPTFANGKVTLVADLNTATACLGTGFSMTHSGVLSVSDDDQTFAAGISNAGGQDTDCFGVTYNRTKGCQVLNTCTSTVSGNWGPSGLTDNTTNSGSPSLFHIHEMVLFHDGQKAMFSSNPGACIAGCGLPGQTWVWYNGLVSGTGKHMPWNGGAENCGHWTVGHNLVFNKCLDTNATGSMNLWGHSSTSDSALLHGQIFNPAIFGPICWINSTVSINCPGDDTHQGWHNDNAFNGTLDAIPAVFATFAVESATQVPITVPNTPTFFWDNEILAMPTVCFGGSCTGQKPWRIAQTRSNPNQSNSAGFADYIAVGSGSARSAYGQNFFVFTSNWQGQLGCTGGGYGNAIPPGTPCTGGNPNQRYDAFIVAYPVTTNLSMNINGITLVGVSVQ